MYVINNSERLIHVAPGVMIPPFGQKKDPNGKKVPGKPEHIMNVPEQFRPNVENHMSKEQYEGELVELQEKDLPAGYKGHTEGFITEPPISLEKIEHQMAVLAGARQGGEAVLQGASAREHFDMDRRAIELEKQEQALFEREERLKDAEAKAPVMTDLERKAAEAFAQAGVKPPTGG